MAINHYVFASLIAIVLTAAPAAAQTAAPTGDQTQSDESVAIHGQATFVAQGTPGFTSPYVGENSLKPNQVRETFDATLFAGVRPWEGAEIWINPEIDQGFGLSNTLGVAGFPSAEAYKVGKSDPYLRLQRLFLRQTISLGGEEESVDAAANQLGAHRTHDHLVITIGKFGVGDVFDTNAYAHDPRGDFLNWAGVDAGTFDYAADAWGYSTGVAGELYVGEWTGRLGLFNLSTIPNGETLESGFGQYQIDGEIEHRHTLAGHAGAVRLTVFRNHGRFATYDDALALAQATGQVPDLTPMRAPRTRWGASVNAEQALSDTLGVFGRIGWADGSIEPYDFTDIDRTAQAGMSLKGKSWGRGDDTIGVMAIVNGISAEHRRYLAAGGEGVLIGDGQLPHYGAEAIGEAYYELALHKGVMLAADYQLVMNPGYNRDRGPANVFALRLHGGF
jgi:high affinity Mn2+ porin